MYKSKPIIIISTLVYPLSFPKKNLAIHHHPIIFMLKKNLRIQIQIKNQMANNGSIN